MTTKENPIIERAIAWHLASEREDMDWDGFTAWLEADPRHREAYDQIALGDSALCDHREALAGEFSPTAIDSAPANDEQDAPRRFWRRTAYFTGGAIAASLALLTVIPMMGSPGSKVYETSASAQMIALDDGSRIELAPRSTLTISGEHQQRLALKGGAWFDIRHDPAREMVIDAGALSIRDIGTRFDVQNAADQVRVEVAEGALSLAATGLDRPIRLGAGRGFRFDAKSHKALTMPVGKGDFGEWREGRLSYDQAPLGLVAADLSRYEGITVELGRGIENRRFSGTLALGDGEASLRDLSQLMGLSLEHGAGGSYRLAPGGR